MDERGKLDAEWAQLKVAQAELERERKEFETEREASGIEHKLFVGNLNASTTEDDILKMFGPYGTIKEIVLLKDKDGKSKRSCFVKYYSKNAAEKCISEINDRVCDKAQEVPMVVRLARPKEAKELSAAIATPARSSFLNAAAAYSATPSSAYTSPATFSNFSNAYGAYGNSGALPAAAAAAAAAAAQVGVGSARRGPIGSNLYVNNLDRFATEDEVRLMFADFGNVISVKLFPGYGFVSYDNAQAAQAAISALNGMMSPDGRRRLEVTLKKDKGGSAASPAPAASSRYQPY